MHYLEVLGFFLKKEKLGNLSRSITALSPFPDDGKRGNTAPFPLSLLFLGFIIAQSPSRKPPPAPPASRSEKYKNKISVLGENVGNACRIFIPHLLEHGDCDRVRKILQRVTVHSKQPIAAPEIDKKKKLFK